MVIFRTTNPRGVQHILTGHPPKGKDLIALNTDKITGKVTAKTSKQWRTAMRAKKGYYILQKDGFAYNRHGQKITGPDGRPVRFDMQAKGKFGELTNRPGQVIEPTTRKAVVGDYDLQDVIQPHSPGRNLAAVPEAVGQLLQFPASGPGGHQPHYSRRRRPVYAVPAFPKKRFQGGCHRYFTRRPGGSFIRSRIGQVLQINRSLPP